MKNLHTTAFTLLLVCFCSSHAQEIKLSEQQIKSLGITTGSAAPQPIAEQAGLAAEVIVPNAQLNVVSTPLPGLIDSVLVAVNEPVKRGQQLARMQSTALAEAQRAYMQASTQLQLARANLDRDQKLAADGLIAESRLLSSKAHAVEATALLAERQHALKLAGMSEAAIAKLRGGAAISSLVQIVAPVDGVVIEQMAQAGQRLEAYTPIYKIAQLDPLWLEIQVPLARAATLSEGAAVNVPSVKATGKIISIGRSVTPASQTIMVRALITVNAKRLRPGQYVEAVVAGAPSQTTQWRVPAESLVRHHDKVYVFVRTAQGFRAVSVNVVNEGQNTALVTGPLSDNDAIAIAGVSALKSQLAGMGG